MRKIIKWAFERPYRFERIALFFIGLAIALVIFVELVNWIF